tara:strand:- start:4757 stop:5092 length:336 start_codon:yes stop_codon:yes gene_type:complete
VSNNKIGSFTVRPERAAVEGRKLVEGLASFLRLLVPRAQDERRRNGEAQDERRRNGETQDERVMNRIFCFGFDSLEISTQSSFIKAIFFFLLQPFICLSIVNASSLVLKEA